MPMDFAQVDLDVAASEQWWRDEGYPRLNSDAREAVMLQDGQRVVALLVPLDPSMSIDQAQALLGGIGEYTAMLAKE